MISCTGQAHSSLKTHLDPGARPLVLGPQTTLATNVLAPPTATAGCTEILDRSLVPPRQLPPGLKVSKARTTAYAPGLTPKGWGWAHRRYMVPLCFPELEPARAWHALGPDNRPTNVPQSPFFLRGENETSGARTGCVRSHRDGDTNAIFMGVRTTRAAEGENTL